MKSSKGFTLIELLAVIVILAIIALIAAPVILGIIDDARKSAAKDSAYGVVASAKLHFAQTLMDTDSAPAFVDGEFTVGGGRVFECDGSTCATATGAPKAASLSVDGTVPVGDIRVENDGTIHSAELKFNGKYCFSVTSSVVEEDTCD